jgi:hypothetical protein
VTIVLDRFCFFVSPSKEKFKYSISSYRIERTDPDMERVSEFMFNNY